MTSWQILGAAILAVVFIGLIGATAQAVGWRDAAFIWGVAVGGGSIVLLGAKLLAGDIP